MAAKPRTRTFAEIMVFAALLLLPALTMANPARPPRASPCSTWTNKTIDKMKKLPERRWRDAIIGALGDGTCPHVPEALRSASRELRRTGRVAAGDRVLADAATRVLGPTCSVPRPVDDSRAIAKICPLPAQEEFNLPESVLKDIRAVDYVLIDALATSFLSSKAYDATTRRLMLNFLLSATLLGEHQREAVREWK